jgi:hypothetical protein
MSKFRFLRATIYKLKRRFGETVTFVRTDVAGTTDFTTGSVPEAYLEKQRVRNVIFMPFALTRNFSYDLSYIAANKNFTYGGMYDIDTSTLILDKRDLKSFVLTLDSRVIKDDVTYVVKKIVEAYQDNSVLIITIVELKGSR